MSRKKNENPSLLDEALSIFANSEGVSEVTNLDDPTYDVDDDHEDDAPGNDKTEDIVKPEDDDNKTDDTIDSKTDDDNSDIPQDVLDRMNGNKPVDNNTENDDDNKGGVDNNKTEDDVDAGDLAEAEQVSALFDAVIESFGFNPEDIEEKKRPLTVDGLTSYFKEMINENSVPQYADERVQKLDEYVKNGGNFEDFYQIQQKAMDLQNIDIEDESNQKAVVRELLKRNGYSDDKIERRIERFEDADMLEEEAEDALDRLRELQQKDLEDAEKEQAEYQRQQQEEAQQFFKDVSGKINKLTKIRGINVPQADRKALYDYIFKTDAQGLSQYQKDFNKNLTKNLIESAYFTMKGDALISEAQRDGESSAAKRLRSILRNSNKNHSSIDVKDEKQPQAWEIASKFL